MTYEKYAEMVNRLTKGAERFPFLYRMKVMLIIGMGYSYIFTLLITAILITSIVILVMYTENQVHGATIKIGLVFLLFAFYILRALWVRVEAPAYPILKKNDAPKLYDEVKQLSRLLKGPRIHRILYYDEYNAFISQIPMFGPFGGYRNYLVIGIPLLAGHNPEELRAILAHEIGHLSKSHGRFGTWIYRVQKTWDTLMDTMNKKGHWGSLLLKGFFNRFVPYLSAHTFVLRRMNEYEADRCAAFVSSPRTVAKMLTRSEVMDGYLHKVFWPGIYRLADDQAFPPHRVYEQMEEGMLQSKWEEGSAWVKEGLGGTTGLMDTHPCLADRLLALNERAHEEMETLSENALRYYLADPRTVFSVLNEKWRNQESELWSERYNYVHDQRGKLQALQEKKASEGLTSDEEMSLAFLTEELYGVQTAFPLFAEIAERQPESPVAQYFFGKFLLKQNNPEGVQRILTAIELDADAGISGYPLIYHYYVDHGQEEEAKKYEESTRKSYAIMEAAQAERTHIFSDDVLIPHKLPVSFIERMKKELKKYSPVVQAYLAEKKLPFDSDEPVFVLGLKLARPLYLWTRKSRDKFDQELAEKIKKEVGYPFQWLIVEVFHNSTSDLQNQIKKVPNSRLR